MVRVYRSYREKSDIIRKKKHKGAWYYSIVDIVKFLGGEEKHVSWYYLRPRLPFVEKHIVKLDMPSFSLNPQPTDCLKMEMVLRVILHLKSQKAEAIKSKIIEGFSDKFSTGEDFADFIINTK